MATSTSYDPNNVPYVPTAAQAYLNFATGQFEYVQGSGGASNVNIASAVAVTQSDITTTGNITSNQSVSISTDSRNAVGIDISGIWSGTVVFEGSADGVTYRATTAITLASGSLVTSSAANGTFQVQCAGLASIRIRGNTVNSGTAIIYLRASVAVSSVMLDNPIPAGTNSIGTVVIGSGGNSIGTVKVVDSSGNFIATISSSLQTLPSANSLTVGTTPYSNTILSNTKQAVKNSAGNLYGYHIYNPNTVPIFVQFFDLAASGVTVGTTTPTFVLTIPATTTSPATLDMQGTVPISFSTAITIAATLTATGSGAPATALNCSLFYK